MIVQMTEEQTTNPDVNETEVENPKEKKPRSILQDEALHKARQKAYENRRLRAEQNKINRSQAIVETPYSVTTHRTGKQ